MRVVVAIAITKVPSTSIFGFTFWALSGRAEGTKPPAIRIKGIVPQNNPRQPNTLSAATPPKTVPNSAAKPVGMLSSPVHFARCEDGKSSPITAKHNGTIGTRPMAIKVCAATRDTVEVLLEEIPRPTMKMAIRICNPFACSRVVMVLVSPLNC